MCSSKRRLSVYDWMRQYYRFIYLWLQGTRLCGRWKKVYRLGALYYQSWASSLNVIFHVYAWWVSCVASVPVPAKILRIPAARKLGQKQSLEDLMDACCWLVIHFAPRGPLVFPHQKPNLIRSVFCPFVHSYCTAQLNKVPIFFFRFRNYVN